MKMKQGSQALGLALLALCFGQVNSARADVKNVWVGVNGAT